ncbi:hypothetical protein [Streptomyces sp. ID05-18]|uniref:hypothetical protein n=1 Tax=Streptomyces sp. ID05-18 TaxID=3028662 RepID=UPI0038323864
MDEEQDQWIRVPVGDDAARWATRVRCRRVLFVVHNVTSATRLLDVLPLFHDDLGVQLLATCTGTSAFRSGVADLFADTGLPALPWEQALATPVDLAISASFGGELPAIQGPLIALSHGIGYTKGWRQAEADADPAVYASAVRAWLAEGRTLAALVEDGLTVRAGRTDHHVVVAAEADGPTTGGTRQRPSLTPADRSTAHANGADTPRAGRRSPRTGS